MDGAIHRAAGPMLRKENITHGGCDDGKAVESGGYCLPAKCKADTNYIIIIVNYPLQMLSLLLAPGMEIQRSFRVPTDLPWRRWWSWDWKPLWVKIRLINNLNYSCRPSLASQLEYMDIPAPLPVIWPTREFLERHHQVHLYFFKHLKLQKSATTFSRELRELYSMCLPKKMKDCTNRECHSCFLKLFKKGIGKEKKHRVYQIMSKNIAEILIFNVMLLC